MQVSPLIVAALVSGALGVLFVAAALAALRRRRPLRGTIRTLIGLLFLVFGALLATIAIGMNGYRALIREDVAARILVQPSGPQRFTATVRIPDRPEMIYEIAGDEVHVDAHILKWHPVVNMLGLHTAYELDRLSGRYATLAQERSAERTVFSLAPDRPVDLFGLRRRYAFLAPLVDAEYGSGTFVPVTRRAEVEVRVSTTGLLIRDVR